MHSIPQRHLENYTLYSLTAARAVNLYCKWESSGIKKLLFGCFTVRVREEFACVSMHTCIRTCNIV